MNIVLPKLLTMTLVSLAIGSVVGAVVGWIATLIWRRRQRNKDQSGSRPWLIKPAILGSFIGMLLIGMLPIEANPASLIGGPYGGLWFMFMFLMLAPPGSISGAILGAILGAKQATYMRRPKPWYLYCC